MEGHFSLSPVREAGVADLAPTTNVGLRVELIVQEAHSELPPNTYPRRGRVVQTYAADGTVVLTGYGAKMLNSTGSNNRYTKVAANMAVEEILQNSGIFEKPYTMVYRFETANSGTWYQNLGNGFITFSGTFTTSPL